MKRIAEEESLTSKEILKSIKYGKVVIPNNLKHYLKNPCGIGYKLKTKVNANIGT